MYPFRWLLLFVCVLLVASRTALSQGATGGISGTITDPSGAVTPLVTVTAVNAATGFTRTTISASDGAYFFALLDPGVYRLRVNAPGFKELERGPITVRVSETASVPLSLELGSAEDVMVVVTAEAPLLQTTSATQGNVFTSRQVAELPLVTRNFTQLLALQPGVVAELPNAAAFGNGTQGLSVTGGRYYDNSVLIDGVNAVGSINSGYGIGPGPLGGVAVPAPDAVQEFKVQTSLYSAEYGRAGGASVNLVTRSGTNRLHGTAYHFLRNEALNANEYFFKRAQIRNSGINEAPILRQNQFGGTVGGPLYKDRTFFFGSYQRTLQLNGAAPYLVTVLNRYPLLPADRSSEAALRRELGAIYGGRKGFPAGLMQGDTPINTILPNGSNISPVALRLLMTKGTDGAYLFPSFGPSGFTDGLGGRSGGQVYSDANFSFPSPFSEHQYSANVDHMINARQTLSVKWFSADQASSLPAGHLQGFLATSEPRRRNLTLAHTYAAASTLVNEFRGGYTRISTVAGLDAPVSAADVGMRSAPGSSVLPQLSITNAGLSVGGISSAARDVEDMFTVSDTVFKAFGSHMVRGGATFVRHQLDTNSDLLKSGQLLMFGFEDFLLGESGAGNNTALVLPNGGSSNLLVTTAQTGSFEKAFRFNDLSFFLQDDWRVRRNLTLNLGLRYDYFAWPVEKYGRLGNFDPTLIAEGPFGIPQGDQRYSGYTVARSLRKHFPNVRIPAGITEVNDYIVKSQDLNNFAPRIGFAWQPWERVSVRGGYGIFYPRVNAEMTIAMSIGYPFNALTLSSFSASGSLQDPFSYLNLPQDSAFPTWAPRTYNPAAIPATVMAPIDPNIRNPYVQQWNFSIGQELGKDLLVEVGYAGSHGLNLLNTRAGNVPVLASPANPVRGVTTNTTLQTNLQARSPIAGIVGDRGLALTTTDAESKYHAGLLSVTKRFSRGLQFLSALTIGKSIDNNSLTSTGAVNNAQVPGDASLQHYGLSTFDRKYRWATSLVYELPGPANRSSLAGRVLGGWQTAGIVIVQSGQPLGFSVQTTASVVKLQGFLTPDLQPGKTLDDLRGSGPVKDRLTRYFASPGLNQPGTLFAVPGPLSYGALGRGLEIRAPGQKSVDFALSKHVFASERVQLQLRGEFFNLMNWVNFGAPATNVSASNFGSISSTTSSPRVIQLALKLHF